MILILNKASFKLHVDSPSFIQNPPGDVGQQPVPVSLLRVAHPARAQRGQNRVAPAVVTCVNCHLLVQNYKLISISFPQM